jgi:hypothetical protein
LTTFRRYEATGLEIAAAIDAMSKLTSDGWLICGVCWSDDRFGFTATPYAETRIAKELADRGWSGSAYDRLDPEVEAKLRIV